MRKTAILMTVTLLALAATVSPIRGQESKARPTVWMGPPSYDNARCFRELFENPEDWKETRSAIDALQKRLAEKGVRGLDFYRLDVNWANFVVQDHGCWGDVRKLEEYCRKRDLPFSLIYWASEQPVLDRMGLADDSTWYVSIMQQGYDYAMVRGRPDQYVIESWIKAPSRSTPESEPWTFTRSVLDFTRKFVKSTDD